tara:strand:- start:1182 stop:2030 length:849 start_codon:yes stop_codon:yes gene_type:complete
MNYLITGASGFLGKNLVNFLEKKGSKVYKCGRDYNIGNQIYFDLEKEIKIEKKILEKVDILIHCAYSFDASSMKRSKKINVDGSEKLFELASRYKIKIIYISSISAFEGCRSVHGKVKLEIEKLANKYNGIILRPGLIYSKKVQGAMFGSLINLVKRIPIIPLIDNGKQILYMCELETLTKLIFILSKKNIGENIIVAANKQPIMFKKIIKIIILKYNLKRILLPFPSIIILSFLKIFETLNINIRLQSDSLVSILNPNQNPLISDLDKFEIIFPVFEKDFY